MGAITADTFIVPYCVIGIAFAWSQFQLIKQVKVGDGLAGKDRLESHGHDTPEQRIVVVYHRIQDGAMPFLREEYRIAGLFCFFFGLLIMALVAWGSKSNKQGIATAAAFWVGASTSMLCGFLGMMIATFSNARTTLSAVKKEDGYTKTFNVAFRGGGVMGYLLCPLGVAVLYILLTVFRLYFDEMEPLMDCVAGYGLGGSTVAMFGRVGGGIYTKAADVGADWVGKVVAGLEEDDPNNPATIADNVGDKVGDIAGMGADLFGSFAEATCAALVIAVSAVTAKGEVTLVQAGWDALLFPLFISAAGIVVCMLCSLVATNISPVRTQPDIEKVLKVQMVLTAALMLPVIYWIATQVLPGEFALESVRPIGFVKGTPFKAFACAAMGTVGGLLTGLVTEYFTSHTYVPVRELATACKSGAAVNVIFGMALGYKSCIIPVFVWAANIYVAFSLCDLYGIALAALGMLSTLATVLTIDGFGPISDNAGGIAELAEFPPDVRERTDALDAAGNTTAAIGKGFALGSAALVALALYGTFVVRLKSLDVDVNLSGVNVLHVFGEVNDVIDDDMIDALNPLAGMAHGCRLAPLRPQAEAIARLEAVVRATQGPAQLDSPEVAVRALLGSDRYDGGAKANLGSYDPERISVPAAGAHPVDLAARLPEDARAYLVDIQEHILLNEEEWGRVCDNTAHCPVYYDPLLNRNRCTRT